MPVECAVNCTSLQYESIPPRKVSPDLHNLIPVRNTCQYTCLEMFIWLSLFASVTMDVCRCVFNLHGCLSLSLGLHDCLSLSSCLLSLCLCPLSLCHHGCLSVSLCFRSVCLCLHVSLSQCLHGCLCKSLCLHFCLSVSVCLHVWPFVCVCVSPRVAVCLHLTVSICLKPWVPDTRPSCVVDVLLIWSWRNVGYLLVCVICKSTSSFLSQLGLVGVLLNYAMEPTANGLGWGLEVWNVM